MTDPDRELIRHVLQSNKELQVGLSQLHLVVSENTGELRAAIGRMDGQFSEMFRALVERQRKHSDRVAAVEQASEKRDEDTLERVVGLEREAAELRGGRKVRDWIIAGAASVSGSVVTALILKAVGG